MFLIYYVGNENLPRSVTTESTTAANMRIVMNQSRHPKTVGSSGTSKKGGEVSRFSGKEGRNHPLKAPRMKESHHIFFGGVFGILLEMRLGF